MAIPKRLPESKSNCDDASLGERVLSSDPPSPPWAKQLEIEVHPPPAVIDFGPFCRVLVILLSLKHASDDEAVSFQHISNWHEACIFSCENAGDGPPRIKSDSSGRSRPTVFEVHPNSHAARRHL